MFQKRDTSQNRVEFVCIEDLVPRDHLLRKIQRHIKFNFIYDRVKDLY
jgi:hypothetical protein